MVFEMLLPDWKIWKIEPVKNEIWLDSVVFEILLPSCKSAKHLPRIDCLRDMVGICGAAILIPLGKLVIYIK